MTSMLQPTVVSQTTEQPKTVAVVTVATDSEGLEKAIISIQQQTYHHCKHYIFIDGKQYWQTIRPLEEKYPNVNFAFLPMTTGENDVGNGAIYGVLPYLVQEDIFCFLDENSWVDSDHVEHLVKMIQQHNLDYAYSLRKIYDKNNQYLCNDNSESIGFWTAYVTVNIQREIAGNLVNIVVENNNDHLIDPSSYAITREMAFKLLNDWYSRAGNDGEIYKALTELNARGGFTGKRTTYYKLNPEINNDKMTLEDFYQILREQNGKIERQGYPWSHPATLIDGKLTIIYG